MKEKLHPVPPATGEVLRNYAAQVQGKKLGRRRGEEEELPSHRKGRRSTKKEERTDSTSPIEREENRLFEKRENERAFSTTEKGHPRL